MSLQKPGRESDNEKYVEMYRTNAGYDLHVRYLDGEQFMSWFDITLNEALQNIREYYEST